jgi:hypothetical protein
MITVGEEEAFQHWFTSIWKYGSSTDEKLARRAWAEARGAIVTPQQRPQLTIDPKRWADEKLRAATGIYVRVKTPDGWDAVDICVLDKRSLLSWLRSRGGSNLWCENTVLLLLGYVPEEANA